MYTALVLTHQDHTRLLSHFPAPAGFQPIAHHMTINMGGISSGPCANRLGEKAFVTVVAYAQDDKVCAVKVETNIPSTNKIKHITIGVNRKNGGKPFHSNNLTNWKEVVPFTLQGMIMEENWKYLK